MITPADQASQGFLANRRRLILHVGMTKAGSTAIQNYLEKCRSELEACGILFPETGFTHGNPFDPERTSGHLELIRRIRRGDVRPLEKEVNGTGAQVVVISAENLFFDRPDDELRAISRYFQGWEIVVIVVLRSQAAWLQSRYVESVVSGYQMSALTGKEFCAVAVGKNWLDYPRAVERVGNLLSADKVLLISYEQATHENRLVEEFLEITDLPRTNDTLAKSIRSNERKKDFGLVEVKRRLNYLLRKWPKDARLAFEAEFRKLADSYQESGADWRPPVQPFQYLSGAQRESVFEANGRLCREFGFTHPLGDASVSVVANCTDQHRHAGKRLEDLTLAGWKLAAEIGRHQNLQVFETKGDPSSIFSLKSIDRLLDMIASARVSVHVGMAGFALVAGSLGHRLPIFLPTDESEGEGEDLIGMPFLRLPSEIVGLGSAKAGGGVATASAILADHAPDIAFARGVKSLGHLSALFSQARFSCPVVLLDAVTADLAGFTKKFDLEVGYLDMDCTIMFPGSSQHQEGAV